MNAPVPQLKPGVILRTNSCENCKFHELYPQNANLVECRRHPPQATAFMVDGPQGRPTFPEYAGFPKVSKNAWCGDWGARILDPKGMN